MQRFDKPGRDTGPGKFTNELTVPGTVVCTYYVYNFNVDGNVLKAEHKAFLDKYVVPLLRDNSMHVKLTGTTSRSGDRAYNRQLSLERVLRVKDYLRSQGIPESKLPGPDIVAAGEDLSTSKSQEDELDRAVKIIVATGIKPRPIHPPVVLPQDRIIGRRPPAPSTPPPPVDPQISDRWMLRQISGSNVALNVPLGAPGMTSVGGGGVQYTFQLIDLLHARRTTCFYQGYSTTGGTNVLPLGGAITSESAIGSPFKTKDPVAFDAFNSEANWHEDGMLQAAKPALELKSLGIVVPITLGTRIGIPVSQLSSGQFTCQSP